MKADVFIITISTLAIITDAFFFYQTKHQYQYAPSERKCVCMYVCVCMCVCPQWHMMAQVYTWVAPNHKCQHS